MENWYMISYDIRHPRRLQRTHRLLKRHASALLESLFVYWGPASDVAQLRTQLLREIRPAEDDLLIYQLRSDRVIHRWGRACLSAGLHDFSLPALHEYHDSNAFNLQVNGGMQTW
ncbi:CRISPR-associated endonuclease Cas2 [Halopseudomonas pachastrellae]|nr:CRISPR-associated endonuclease Cas2 [Halopseudomonas pachastrellae]